MITTPILKLALTAIAAIATAGCTSNRAVNHDGSTTEETTSDVTDTVLPAQLKINPDSMKQTLIPSQGPAGMMPKAILYKTSGDFLYNVPVQINADGSLISYPAPSDIPENATPVKLKSGWMISPVGVGKNTTFTTYTYDEYRKLEKAPSPEEILKAVIPGSRVTITIQAPMTLQQALADPDAVDRYLSPTPRQ